MVVTFQTTVEYTDAAVDLLRPVCLDVDIEKALEFLAPKLIERFTIGAEGDGPDNEAGDWASGTTVATIAGKRIYLWVIRKARATYVIDGAKS